MNDASPSTNPVLVKALRILSELAAPGSPVFAEWSSTFAAELASFLPPPPEAPTDLIATEGVGPGAVWHAEQLATLCQPRPTDESPPERARRVYHAKMLGHCLAPDRVEFRPLVTILIPVFNRARPLVEAVESCLSQTWRPIEVLVIDDGSTDDPAAALARFGSDVRLCRRAHGGVAGARNLGLKEATGDFVHFLDSDDLLLPSAVERKLEAFRICADSDLCYSQSQWIDMRVSPPAEMKERFRTIDHPIRSMIVGFPFLLQTVMIPRWRLLAAASFEEDLRRSSDFRYWQHLGLAGVKVIGNRTLGTRLRRFHDSLHMTPEPKDDSHAVALLRGLRDLARHPHAWRHGADYLNILDAERARYWLASARSERVRSAATEAAEALKEAAQGIPSALPMFAAMRAHRSRLQGHGGWPDGAPDSIYRLLTDTIDRCCTMARRFDDRDMAFWSPGSEASVMEKSLARFFTAIETYCEPRRRARLAGALLSQCPRIPGARLVRRAAFRQRLFGTAIATRMVGGRMTRKEA
ncbi:glycosyltransferase family A protein [Dongia deserti]|uniref:glycosyltransferase family A protein n=1 Tax=Dongia deserti TaxID=2268030 RepID=UPI000E648200|nr:glycosyltransferase family 2 protein [Dongia deserti]